MNTEETFFFILGSNPILSATEILAFLDRYRVKYDIKECYPAALLISASKDLDIEGIMHGLGGTVKAGRILFSDSTSEKRLLSRKIVAAAFERYEGGKVLFGLSNYSSAKIDTKNLGMEIKSDLKERGFACRLVVSRDITLSSVVVEQNKLISKGAEIVFLDDTIKKQSYYVGQTLAVQPFKDLSFRDFSRPARDDKSGMLPPKLAKIMINLSQANEKSVLLDPFCGSGTVLMEALLMGIERVIGSDISAKAYADTKTNLEWLKMNYELRTLSAYELFQLSATELSKKIKPGSVDVIVTEPYLGPQRGFTKFDDVAEGLNKLYTDSIKEFYKVLRLGGRVIMVWPIMRSRDQIKQLNPNINGFKIINSLSKLPSLKDWSRRNGIGVGEVNTNRPTVIYGREDQKIWREIVILEKKS